MSTTRELPLHEAAFRAFGSTCRIVCDVELSVLAGIHRLEDLESRWSRFRRESEVSSINRNAGSWVEVSAATSSLLAHAVDAWRLTNGVFNPLMLRHIEAIGYRDTHQTLELSRASLCATNCVGEPAAAADLIEFDGGSVRLAPGTGFDPGGVGKGLAADLVMADLLDAGATWAVVSLGGDVRFGGALLAEAGALTHLDDPRRPGTLFGTTHVYGGAMATSSSRTRRWVQDDVVHHHLLDPSTGVPTRSTRAAATVFAPTGWQADVIAKALVIDENVGVAQVRSWGGAALVFTNDGAINLGLDHERAT